MDLGGVGALTSRAGAAARRLRSFHRACRRATEAAMRSVGHFIGGREVAGTSGRTGDVYDPNTGEVQAKVAFASPAEVAHAIAGAQAAQPAWAATKPPR